MDSEYFAKLCLDAAAAERSKGANGFGTLAEKRLHAVIKHYLCPNEALHEVAIPNSRFLADVCIGKEIFEVQTGSFYPLREKIEHYLTATDYNVTVVHPIPAVRYLSWIDPDSFEIGKARRVSGGKATDLLPRLYYLRPYLNEPRLRFRLLMLEVHDFRLQNGTRSPDRKRGSVRYERMPTALLAEMDFQTPADFEVFLPDTLENPFTVAQFAKWTRLRSRNAYSAVHALHALNLITPISSRPMRWERK